MCQSTLRKTISFILLSTILMNSIGYVAVYALIRWHVTHEISELIEHHDENEFSELILPLSVVQQPNKDFTRLNKREFRYKGKMFDIVTQKRIGQAIHFIVIHDPNDEQNFNRLAENTNLQSQTPKNTETGKSVLIDIIAKGLFSPLYSVKSTTYQAILHQHSLALIQNIFLPETPCLRVPVPPPKIS